MSAITAKASRKMKKYAVLTREPRCFLGSLAFSWEQRKVSELAEKTYGGGTPSTLNEAYWDGDIPWIQSSDVVDGRLFGVVPRKRITQYGLNNSATQLVPKNSIAIVADGLFCREIDGLFCRSSPDIIVRRRCVLSHKRRGWLQPSPSFRYSRNLALQDELYHPVINNGPAVLVCVDKRLGTGPVNQSRDAG